MKKWRWALLFIICVAVLWCLPSLVESLCQLRPAPPVCAWEIRFNDKSIALFSPSCLSIDGNGDLLVNGSGIKDGRGGALVLKYRGDTGHELWRIASEIAVASAPVTNASDNVYLAGSVARGYRPGPIAPPFSGPDTDFAMSKMSGENRGVDWTRSFDGGLNDTDWAEKLVLAADGNPVAAGFTPDDTRYFGCVHKVDAKDGRMIWQYRTQNTPVVFWHGSLDLAVAKDGGVVVASTRKSDDSFKAEATFWMAKLNQSDGTVIWTIEFPQRPPQSHFLRKVAMLPDGDLVAVGYHARSRGRSLIVARFSGSGGRLIWDKDIHGDTHEALEPTGLLVDAGGNVLVGARSWNGSAASPLYDSWVIKLSSADGRDMWTKRDAGVPAPYDAGQICSTRKLLPGVYGMFLSAGSFWNGKNADVRVDWMSSSDGSVRRSLIYDGAAGDNDLFRDATGTPDGEIVVALSSSRCPAWIKPLKDLRYRLSGGRDWRSIHSETNNLDDADPYNYDCIVWRSLPVSVNSPLEP